MGLTKDAETEEDERAALAVITGEARRTAKVTRKKAAVIFAILARRRRLNVREEEGMLRTRRRQAELLRGCATVLRVESRRFGEYSRQMDGWMYEDGSGANSPCALFF